MAVPIPLFDTTGIDAPHPGESEFAQSHSTPPDQSAAVTEPWGFGIQGFGRQNWLEHRPDWAHAGWWDADLRPEVRQLMRLPVGAELAAALTTLLPATTGSTDPTGTCPADHYSPTQSEVIGVPGSPCGCHIVVAAAWAAVASWAGHRTDEALLTAAGDEPITRQLVADSPEFGTITYDADEEVAPALWASAASADHRIDGARRVVALPELWRAVESGLVIDWHARLLAADLKHLDVDLQRAVVGQLLALLRARRADGLVEWTFTDLRVRAKRIAARLDRDFAARRRQCQVDRDVRLRLNGDGSGRVAADLPEDTASRLFNRLTALATGLDDPEDARTLAQKRADVFTDLLLGGQTCSGANSSPACPATPVAAAGSGEVVVVIEADALLGASQTPAMVPGVGPLPVEIARQLAADLPWRAWVAATTTAGRTVVATSPGTYRPGPALARLIRAREPYCRMPGCRSTRTDLDHVVPFPKGSTVPENLGPLCRRHHRMKTHTRWRQSVAESEGSDPTAWTWTSPSGITYQDSADPNSL